MMVVFPVSGFLNPLVMCISAEIDAPNIGEYLLLVPVRIRFICTDLCYAIIFMI